MRKIFLLSSVLFTSLLTFSQSDEELMNMLARVCRLDSISRSMGHKLEGDSLTNFNFLTPSYEEMGTPVYDFDDFRITFDIGSNLMIAGVPYGKLEVLKYGKSKAVIEIVIARGGDRVAEKKWTYAEFTFTRPKNGKWLLSDTKFYLTEKL